jgi:hypothetical protein
MTITVICPKCQHALALPETAVGQEQTCANCRALLRVEASGVVCLQEAIQAQLPAPAANPVDPASGKEMPDDLRHTDKAPPDLLDQIENVLWRMLTGVFRFTFLVLPQWIRRELRRISPTLIKLARVAGLLLCWLAVVWLPLVLCVVCKPGALWLLASVTWSVVALAGSAWGVQWAFKRWLIKGTFKRTIQGMFKGNKAEPIAAADRAATVG